MSPTPSTSVHAIHVETLACELFGVALQAQADREQSINGPPLGDRPFEDQALQRAWVKATERVRRTWRNRAEAMLRELDR